MGFVIVSKYCIDLCSMVWYGREKVKCKNDGLGNGLW